jgi:hypothetical protein
MLLLLVIFFSVGAAHARTVTCEMDYGSRLRSKGNAPKSLELELDDSLEKATVRAPGLMETGESDATGTRQVNFRPLSTGTLAAFEVKLPEESPDGPSRRRIALGFLGRFDHQTGRTRDAIVRVEDFYYEDGVEVHESAIYHCGPGLLRVVPLSFPVSRIPEDIMIELEKARKPRRSPRRLPLRPRKRIPSASRRPNRSRESSAPRPDSRLPAAAGARGRVRAPRAARCSWRARPSRSKRCPRSLPARGRR